MKKVRSTMHGVSIQRCGWCVKHQSSGINTPLDLIYIIHCILRLCIIHCILWFGNKSNQTWRHSMRTQNSHQPKTYFGCLIKKHVPWNAKPYILSCTIGDSICTEGKKMYRFLKWNASSYLKYLHNTVKTKQIWEKLLLLDNTYSALTK